VEEDVKKVVLPPPSSKSATIRHIEESKNITVHSMTEPSYLKPPDSLVDAHRPPPPPLHSGNAKSPGHDHSGDNTSSTTKNVNLMQKKGPVPSQVSSLSDPNYLVPPGGQHHKQQQTIAAATPPLPSTSSEVNRFHSFTKGMLVLFFGTQCQ
jgi:hypothetical protein